MPGGAFGRRAGAGDSLSFVAGFPTLPRRAVLRVAPWVTFRFGRSAWGRSALSLEELFGLTVAPVGAKKVNRFARSSAGLTACSATSGGGPTDASRSLMC